MSANSLSTPCFVFLFCFLTIVGVRQKLRSARLRRRQEKGICSSLEEYQELAVPTGTLIF